MTEQERDQLIAQAEQARVNGNYEAAQPLYEQVVAACPALPDAHTGLGHCLLNTGFFDEALVEYEKVVELLPNDKKALLTYGKALCMLGMFDEAKAMFLKVLEIDPDDPDAHEQMAYFPE
jgi:tetratricopeptide (TPR) repeat protein